MHNLSEDDISVKYITPALTKSGWDETTQIRRQVSFTKGRIIVRGRLVSRGKAKKADDDGSGKEPRYYQVNAVNAAVEAIAKGQRPRPAGHGDRHRQDLHRLPDHLAAVEGRPAKAHPVPGRPQRADRPDHGQRLPALRRGHGQAQHQSKTIERDDGTEETDLTTAIDKKRRIDTSYEIYLGLYQAITGPEERQKLFREFSPGFFDLIVIDECHRGSAAEDSRLARDPRVLLRATQIGLTATPKETEYVSNIAYFGEPVYTYSLKQGIRDGFLAPYKVVKVHIDRDVEGYRPERAARPRRRTRSRTASTTRRTSTARWCSTTAPSSSPRRSRSS
jgi:type I restriction enzyme, R subunit